MKKLLGIVVLGLLCCNVGFAELITLKKCYIIDFIQSDTDETYSFNSWEEQKASPGIFVEEHLFTLDTVVETITATSYFKNSFIKRMKEVNIIQPKIQKHIYKIVDLGGNVATAEYFGNDPDIKKKKIDLDFVSNIAYLYDHIIYGNTDVKTSITLQCSRQK